MLQTYSSQHQQQQQLFDDGGQGPGLVHYFEIAKRRLFYFAIPFVLFFALGVLVVAIQRPIYLAEGKILVETQDIPADLVRPTVTDTANQRIQVIQQRIMTRDNLLAVVNKFGLFASQKQWMSGTQLLDLMRERTQLKLVDLTLPTAQNNLTIAFTLSFEYENPDIAMRVANEFLTLILNEDARTRVGRASETTKFLEQEVKRLQGVVGATEGQIAEIKTRPRDPIQEVPEQVRVQMATLTSLKAELAEKSSIYSDSHPAIKALKAKIAGLERLSTQTLPAKQAAPVENGLDGLQRQLENAEKNLDDANRKLATARLGESLERNQQSERLQVLEQPALPQKPIKPNRLKLLALALALSGMAGVGTVFAAETLDRSIRGVWELAAVVDSHLIVAIPYISTKAETLQKRRRLIFLLVGLAAILLAGFVAALYLGIAFDVTSSWLDGSWIDRLTGLLK
jgi:uncharacterized protein involved in exopolysaccharide biosynthesis